MPVESQAARPLGRRDRRFLFVLALVAVAAVAAGAVYAATRSPGSSGGRCITGHLQSTMGGVTVHHCGADAAHYCRDDATAPPIVQACRKAGFRVGRAVS